MSFHNIRLPYFVESILVSSIKFDAQIITAKSGREIRNLTENLARKKYYLEQHKFSQLEFEQIYAFFQARAGSYCSFRLRDPVDYKVENQIIAVGDGRRDNFKLFKTYGDYIDNDKYIYSKYTKLPIVESLILFLDNQIIEDLEVNPFTGEFRLNSPLEENNTLTASFEFDHMVRFNQDDIQYEFNIDGTISINNFSLIEVL